MYVVNIFCDMCGLLECAVFLILCLYQFFHSEENYQEGWDSLVVEQELLTLPEQLNSPPVFSGVRVTRSLVLYVCFPDRCLSFCAFSFGHCVVCSSIYGF